VEKLRFASESHKLCETKAELLRMSNVVSCPSSVVVAFAVLSGESWFKGYATQRADCSYCVEPVNRKTVRACV